MPLVLAKFPLGVHTELEFDIRKGVNCEYRFALKLHRSKRNQPALSKMD